MVEIYNKVHNFPELGQAKVMDLGATSTLATLSRSGASGILLGISCQPFARTGMQRGLSDNRDLTKAFLVALWALQLDWAIVECVAPLEQFDRGKVRRDFEIALNTLGYVLRDRVTNVRDVRPMLSNRWTAIVLPSRTHQLLLMRNLWSMAHAIWTPRHVNTLSAVGAADWLYITDFEVNLHLDFDNAEQQCYNDPELIPRTGRRPLGPQDILPRPMHRMTSHTRRCPCGCAGPLGKDFMLAGGGVFVNYVELEGI